MSQDDVVMEMADYVGIALVAVSALSLLVMLVIS